MFFLLLKFGSAKFSTIHQPAGPTGGHWVTGGLYLIRFTKFINFDETWQCSLFWTLKTMVTAISNKIHIWGLKVAFFFANRHTSKEYQRVQWVHSSQAWGLAFVVIIFYHKGLMLVQMLGLDDLSILRSLGGTCVPLSLPLKSQRSPKGGCKIYWPTPLAFGWEG